MLCKKEAREEGLGKKPTYVRKCRVIAMIMMMMMTMMMMMIMMIITMCVKQLCGCDG